MEDSEIAAIARAKAGEGDAFRLLVERHSRGVFRLAYRMTGNEHDAEDAVQETFLRAYRQLARFDARASFATWVYRIASNYCLDQLRARERRTATELTDTIACDHRPQPDRERMSTEIEQRIDAALGTLTAQERTAFVLRHYEGQSIEQIGAALGIGANATKNSVFRAVQKLRRALEPFVGATSCTRT